MAHLYLTVIIPSVLSFLVTFFATEFILGYFYDAGIIGEDRNKEKDVRLPSSGGVAVAFGFIVGILTYTFGGSFLFNPDLSIELLLSAALSVMLIAFIGFLDDLNVKAKRVDSTGRKDIRKGLKQWQKPLLTVIGALPLVAINAGIGIINVPLLGQLNLGIIYPIIIIPLAVLFVSNAFNLLGGFDGLQTGMGLAASLGFVIYSIFYGNYMGLILSSVLFTSILAFLPFNSFPSKVIPGDSFTYAVGGALVVIMIMGQAEAFGFVVFMPWIIEFFLHLRKKFKVSDLGIRQRDGTMKAPYGGRIYSLTHLIMNTKRVKEQEVSMYLTLLEIGFVALALALKFSGLL